MLDETNLYKVESKSHSIYYYGDDEKDARMTYQRYKRTCSSLTLYKKMGIVWKDISNDN